MRCCDTEIGFPSAIGTSNEYDAAQVQSFFGTSAFFDMPHFLCIRLLACCCNAGMFTRTCLSAFLPAGPSALRDVRRPRHHGKRFARSSSDSAAGSLIRCVSHPSRSSISIGQLVRCLSHEHSLRQRTLNMTQQCYIGDGLATMPSMR